MELAGTVTYGTSPGRHVSHHEFFFFFFARRNQAVHRVTQEDEWCRSSSGGRLGCGGR